MAEEILRDIRRRWGERLDRFVVPCPLCRGAMRFHGAGRERLYEFADGEPEELTPVAVAPLTFICEHCGFTSDFDAELFNPAHLAQLQGEAPALVAALTLREYQVLVPLSGAEKSETLLELASAVAGVHRGEVLALHVDPEATGDDALDEVVRRRIEAYVPAPGNPTPVRLLRRRGGDVGETIVATAADQRVELLLAGWRGWSRARGAAMGSVLDTLLEEALCDVALVHDRGLGEVRRILLPTAGGPHTRIGARLALDLARAFEAELDLLYVAAPGRPDPDGDAQAAFDRTLREVYEQADDETRARVGARRVLVGDDPAQAIVETAAGYDLLVMGASPRKWLGRVRRGDLALKIARNANPTSLVVSARNTRLRSWVNRLLG